MRAMDYISSTDICYLVCDALSLMGKEPVEHGMRIAYMLMKLLQSKGVYDEYEAAEFVFLAMIHDIGVYKTEQQLEEFLYEEEEASNPHAVYGALFLKNVSPFGDRSNIIMYHHLPYSKISRMNFEHDRIAMYLSLLEDVDKQYRKDGIKMDCSIFEAQAGEKYYPEGVVLLTRCIRQEHILEKLMSGEYEQELREFMNYVLFTNEEKEHFVKFIMHCFSFIGKMRTVEAIICCCVVNEIAEDMELTMRDKEMLDYAAMLHDIGMLGINKKILKSGRILTAEEKEALKGHVGTGTELLKKYFVAKEVVDIIAAHHELLDGNGYPAGLREAQMTQLQRILQVADCVVSLMNMKKDKQGLTKEQIIGVLLKQVQRERLDSKAVQSVIHTYDIIDKKVHSETLAYLEIHVRINNRYKLLVNSDLGEEA